MPPAAARLDDDGDEIADDDIDDVDAPDPEPAPSKPPPKAKKPSRAPVAPLRSSQLGQMQEDEVASVREWMEALGVTGPVRVAIHRTAPLMGPNGESVAGWLETVEEMIDEEYLGSTWGGGKFQLKVTIPDRQGVYKYLKACTIKIAGDVKQRGRVLSAAPAAPAGFGGGGTELADRAMTAMENATREERDRARRIESESRSSGLDAATIASITGPFQAQIESLTTTIATLQKQVIDVSTRPPPVDSFRDKLVEQALGGENKAVEQLRTIYDARIEKMRDNFDDERKRMQEQHAAAITRLESRHEREIDAMEKRHARDIAATEKTAEAMGGSTKVAYDTRIDGLKAENARLERELTEMKSRMGTLESKKDQSLTEKAEEIAKLQETLEGLGIGGGSDADKKWYEKLIDGLGSSEAVMTLINKFGPGAGPDGAGGGAPPKEEPPVGMPFQIGDGNTYVRNADGSYRMIQRGVPPQLARAAGAKAKKKRKQAAAVAAAGLSDVVGDGLADDDDEGEGEGEGDEGDGGDVAGAPARRLKPPPADKVALAVTFMENAIRSNASPATFGQTARNLMDGATLAYIQQAGVDDFLNQVARLEPGSPLTTQKGRNFARAVHKFLTEGTTE